MVAEDIQRFHDDLRAAVLAKVPLDIGDASVRSDSLTLSRISQLQEKLAHQKNDNAKSSATLPLRYQAALKVFECTGLMTPVLNGLSTRPIANNDAARAFGWTWRYLGLLVGVAYCGLYLFAYTIIPTISDMRADTFYSVSKQALAPESFYPTWPAALPVIGCILILVFGWGIFGGAKRWSQWLGGYRYTQMRLKETAIHTIQLLVATNMPLESAIDTSCQLVGMDTYTQQQIRLLSHEDLGQLSSKTEQLNFLANQTFLNMKLRTPIFAVAVVGGLIGLLYAILIFQPITSMLQELGGLSI